MPEPKLIEYANGDKHWWLNNQLHREDGPAIEYTDGHKAWYLNDLRHRLDGPAIETADGRKYWYLNGKEYTEEEYVMIQFMIGKNIYA